MTLVYPLDHPHHVGATDLVALLGGKAANLGVMARDLGLPVPPGFVITTDACRQVLAGEWPAELEGEIRHAMAGVEKRLGRRFGDATHPLLVSVRSGAPVSMPGMMDTVLDIGATSATAPGLAAIGGDDFAADCRRRLAAMFRDVVAAGPPPDDPWLQLREAIDAVFRSWHSDRARAYRAHERIPDDMGTAVTVQAMVFGNRDDRSATGVLFTRNPATGEPVPYGDVVFGGQGEDVVAGTHATEPIAVLDERLPEVAAELHADATRLERHYRDLCDIEFTIESGRLWLLQVRVGKRTPQAALRMAVDMAEDDAFPLRREEAVRRVAALLDPPPTIELRRADAGTPIARGFGASPGIATGEIATSAAAAEEQANAGRRVILVRAETSPADVHGMARAQGILTATGGIASHAAVVARGWAIPAVVGASAVRVEPSGIDVDGRALPAGTTITIDGGSGEVFLGTVEVSSEPLPAARMLLEWARELHVPTGEARPTTEAADEPDAPPAARADEDATSEDRCLSTIGIKGFATAEALSDAIGAGRDDVDQIAGALVAAGLATSAGGAYRLTDAGQARHQRLIEAERAAIGPEEVASWLDHFVELDHRMKDGVTAWQLRATRPGEEPILNDHADPAYDAAVLARLAALADEAGAWLVELEGASARLGRYRARLAGAVAQSAAGDHRFVASPRVDSLHGIWFELHEELILLAGRTRADEVAAGRA
jgi:pyruvate, orthophosphate dikinase